MAQTYGLPVSPICSARLRVAHCLPPPPFLSPQGLQRTAWRCVDSARDHRPPVTSESLQGFAGPSARERQPSAGERCPHPPVRAASRPCRRTFSLVPSALLVPRADRLSSPLARVAIHRHGQTFCRNANTGGGTLFSLVSRFPRPADTDCALRRHIMLSPRRFPGMEWNQSPTYTPHWGRNPWVSKLEARAQTLVRA